VVVRAPVLAGLGFVVAVPFAVGLGVNIFLILIAVLWLALTGFSIPVAMLERDGDLMGWFARLGDALRRSVSLARVAYLHAAGVVAALFIIEIVFGILLAGALVGFGESSGLVAVMLAQLVLAPFFFFALAHLYYDQKARAAAAPPGPA
jgi:hypothetical protein